jgi:hypothetical protein
MALLVEVKMIPLYPDAEKVILVMDNLIIHSGASLYEAFTPDEAGRLLERLEIH